MKNLREFLDVHTKASVGMFHQEGVMMPLWVVETKHEGTLVMLTPWQDEAGKEASVEIIKKIMRAKGAERYIFVTEAWEVCPQDGQIPKSKQLGASLASHPDRREILLLTAEDRKHQLLRRFYILRPEHGKPTLSEPETTEEDAPGEGRFMGLLRNTDESHPDRP